ncbi:MAG: LolA family protein [Acidobacteriota bacterium]
MKKRGLLVLAALWLMGSIGLAQGADAKAEQILKQARAAIADEGKFKSFVGLQATGTVRQTFGDRQNESELEIEMMAPDKIKKSQISSFGTIVTALNGDQLWNDFVPAVGMGGGGGMMRMMGGGPGGQASPMATMMQTQQKRELVQAMLGWLLLAPPGAKMQYAFVGEAPGPEGVKLDVIDAKSADGWSVRLYIGQEDHRLFGLSYKSKQLRRNFGGPRPGGQAGQGGQASQGGQAGQSGQRPQMTQEERDRRMKEFMEQIEKSPDVDFRWVFEDYKGVGGFNLPHRLTKIEAGTPNEEWTLSKIKLNAKMTADRFEKKEK